MFLHGHTQTLVDAPPATFATTVIYPTPQQAPPRIEAEVAITRIFDGIEQTSTGRGSRISETNGVHRHAVVVRSPLAVALESLHKLTLLHSDWDGYGAPAISASAVTSALALLREIQPMDAIAPAIVPAGDGSIFMEWRTSHHSMTVEVLPSGSFHGSYEGDIGEMEWDGVVSEGVDPRMARVFLALSTRRGRI